MPNTPDQTPQDAAPTRPAYARFARAFGPDGTLHDIHYVKVHEPDPTPLPDSMEGVARGGVQMVPKDQPEDVTVTDCDDIG